jgi:uncharacterized membrane protein
MIGAVPANGFGLPFALRYELRPPTVVPVRASSGQDERCGCGLPCRAGLSERIGRRVGVAPGLRSGRPGGAVGPYIAVYPDADAARLDWLMLRDLAMDDQIKVDGLILVSRRSDGKIHVDDDFHTAAKGAAWGAVGGAIIGLIFPPTLLAGALVGGAAGLGVGGLVSHGEKAEVKADVEDAMPLNSSGIVALFDEKWAGDIDQALMHATNVTKEKVDGKSAQQVKDAVAKSPPA